GRRYAGGKCHLRSKIAQLQGRRCIPLRVSHRGAGRQKSTSSCYYEIYCLAGNCESVADDPCSNRNVEIRARSYQAITVYEGDVERCRNGTQGRLHDLWGSIGRWRQGREDRKGARL